MVQGHTHEMSAVTTEVTVGSDRSFGFVFAVFFAVLGLWPLTDGGDPVLPLLGTGGGFLLVALVFPRALGPLNLLWFKFGMILHHVVTPVVMGLLFFLVLTPVALAMRVAGRHPAIFGRAPADAASYWITRTPPGPAPASMKNQF